MKYEYDESGNVNKEITLKDNKVLSYIVFENGKIIREERFNEIRDSSTIYTYTKDGKLEQKTTYSNDKVWDDIKYEYQNNHISKLYYLDRFGRENREIKPTIVIFKYKFDKQKNWIEIIKNVNGKDLYKWVRKIEYY